MSQGQGIQFTLLTDETYSGLRNAYDALLHLLRSCVDTDEYRLMTNRMSKAFFSVDLTSSKVVNGTLIDFLDLKRNLIRECPTKCDKMFVNRHIADVVAEFQSLKRSSVDRPLLASTCNATPKELENYGLDKEGDFQNVESNKSDDVTATSNSDAYSERVLNARIQRMESTLKDYHIAIQSMEEAEVDLDDDSASSNYVRLSRLKAIAVKLYKKIANARNASADLGFVTDKKFHLKPRTAHDKLNTELEAHVNKKCRRARRKRLRTCNAADGYYFPDFAEILDVVKCVAASTEPQVNARLNSTTSKELVHQEALAAFTLVGNQLKRRRMLDERDVMMSYVDRFEDESELVESSNDTFAKDPAKQDSSLSESLKANDVIAKERMDKVLLDFTARQDMEENGEGVTCAASHAILSGPSSSSHPTEEGRDSTAHSPTLNSRPPGDSDNLDQSFMTAEINCGEIEIVDTSTADAAVLVSIPTTEPILVDLSEEEDMEDRVVAGMTRVVKRQARNASPTLNSVDRFNRLSAMGITIQKITCPVSQNLIQQTCGGSKSSEVDDDSDDSVIVLE